MYLLDFNKLEPGDILLTTQKHIESKAIKAFTASDFSHAILHIGGGSYIHSDGNGVHSGNIQRLLFKKEKYVKVLRIKNTLDESLKDKVCVYARREVGKEYSVKDAIRTKNPLTKKQEGNRQFCSRLVAQAYQYAGIELVKNPMFCTPQELDDSPDTVQVKDCLKKADDSEIKFAKSLNPLKKQAKVTNGIFKDFRKATDIDVQTFEQLLNVLFDDPTYDKVASEIIQKSGYLSLWESEIKKNAWRYNYDVFVSLPYPEKKLIEIAESELERATESKKRFVYQYRELMILWERKQLQFLSLEIKLYKQLINNDERCIDVCTKFINHT